MKDLLTPPVLEKLLGPRGSLHVAGTRHALAALLEIDPATLYRYETGKALMPMKVQIAIWAICKHSRFLHRVRAGRAFTREHLIRAWLPETKQRLDFSNSVQSPYLKTKDG